MKVWNKGIKGLEYKKRLRPRRIVVCLCGKEKELTKNEKE